MKKLSLLVVLASIGLALNTAGAQSLDTTKNKVEIKKKTKVNKDGQVETKIKMESKGTPEAVTGAVESAVTGRARAATPATPATATTSATPAQPASPSVVVVEREPVTKVVPVPVEVQKPTVTTRRTTTTTVNTKRVPKTAVKRTSTAKPIASSSTTTTTTVSTN